MQHCTRIFTFDAAHKVLEHKSKCKYLHGHTYKLELTCVAPQLDKLGMVADFGDIKLFAEKWLNENLDHNTILNELDPLLDYLKSDEGLKANSGRMPYLMPKQQNPTAENLAQLLCFELDKILRQELKVEVYEVRLWETPNCSAPFYNPRFKPVYQA